MVNVTSSRKYYNAYLQLLRVLPLALSLCESDFDIICQRLDPELEILRAGTSLICSLWTHAQCPSALRMGDCSPSI